LLARVLRGRKKQIGGDVTLLVTGHGVGEVAKQAAGIAKVKKVSGGRVLAAEGLKLFRQVLVADAASLAHAQAEATAATVAAAVSKFNFTHVLAPSDSRGKNFLPRAAALLDVNALSDITAVVSEDTFVRPIYAGNALATVQSLDKV
jgi:electron transfer flavoprotein alpha subunit